MTRRYEKNRSIVLTTNKPFAKWPETRPNAAGVVTVVDRLMHRAEIVTVEADSYHHKEAEQRRKELFLARKRQGSVPETQNRST